MVFLFCFRYIYYCKNILNGKMVIFYVVIYYELDKMILYCVRKLCILWYYMKFLLLNIVFWIFVMLMCIIKFWVKINVKIGL